MATDTVGTAVVQETVSQIFTGLLDKYESKSDTKDSMERLEMAHIKLEAALEVSSKWIITDASLLRWRKKLKRAAQDCDDTLRRCKQRVLEEECMEQEVSNASFPRRIAHATRSLVSSAFRRCTNNESSSRSSVVRRFEWYADGAAEFMRFVQLGGTPRHQSMPCFAFLVRQLIAGKELHHRIVTGGCEHPSSFLLWLAPFRTTDHGVEATLKIIQKYGSAPENNFFFGAMLQVSEDTDVVGTIVKGLQLFLPHFQSPVEIIKKQLFELPTQDYLWVPHVDLFERKHWDDLHSFSTRWFRPDPLCCKQRDHRNKLLHHGGTSNNLSLAGISDASLPEAIIEMNLQCQVLCSETEDNEITTLSSSECKRDIALEELKEVMIQKALDYFHRNVDAAVYQMLWSSRHGTAYIQVEKASMDNTQGTRRTARRGSREVKLVQLQDRELGSRTHMVDQFLNSWVAHAPTRLRGLVLNWIQKERERQRAVQRYTRICKVNTDEPKNGNGMLTSVDRTDGGHYVQRNTCISSRRSRKDIEPHSKAFTDCHVLMMKNGESQTWKIKKSDHEGSPKQTQMEAMEGKSSCQEDANNQLAGVKTTPEDM